MDCVVPGQEDVFIAPVSYPYDVLAQDGWGAISLEDTNELVDP
jgi:hypothetical protein